eukprot:1127715-Pyramimonas_sp.AAC.1
MTHFFGLIKRPVAQAAFIMRRATVGRDTGISLESAPISSASANGLPGCGLRAFSRCRTRGSKHNAKIPLLSGRP